MWLFNGNWKQYGGSNDEIWKQFDDPNVQNEIRDYLLTQEYGYIYLLSLLICWRCILRRTWLDVMKNMVLPNFPFLSLLFVIFTSLYSANIFAVGYIVVAGGLLILGPFKLFMRNIGNTRRCVQYLLAYNLLVISIKFILCTSVEQVPVTEPALRFVFMDWSLVDTDCPCIRSPKGRVNSKSDCYNNICSYINNQKKQIRIKNFSLINNQVIFCIKLICFFGAKFG